MSQSKCPKISIRQRPGAEGKISTGANTMLYLDDKLLGSAYFVKVEVHAKKVSRVTIEMYAEVEMEINTTLVENKKESKNLKNSKGKPIGIYTLSSYEPKTTVYKDEK